MDSKQPEEPILGLEFKRPCLQKTLETLAGQAVEHSERRETQRERALVRRHIDPIPRSHLPQPQVIYSSSHPIRKVKLYFSYFTKKRITILYRLLNQGFSFGYFRKENDVGRGAGLQLRRYDPPRRWSPHHCILFLNL